jgi:iron complex outermembrane receptor protein
MNLATGSAWRALCRSMSRLSTTSTEICARRCSAPAVSNSRRRHRISFRRSPLTTASKAHTHGVEIAVDWSPLPWWRIQPIYSYLSLTSSSTSGSPVSIANAQLLNGSDPQHQWSLRSSMSLTDRQQFDLWLRYVSKLGGRSVSFSIPAYTTLDLRYAWRPTRDLELSVVGQNLLDNQHPEFVPSLLPGQALEIERGVYLKANWQF